MEQRQASLGLIQSNGHPNPSEDPNQHGTFRTFNLLFSFSGQTDITNLEAVFCGMRKEAEGGTGEYCVLFPEWPLHHSHQSNSFIIKTIMLNLESLIYAHLKNQVHYPLLWNSFFVVCAVSKVEVIYWVIDNFSQYIFHYHQDCNNLTT